MKRKGRNLFERLASVAVALTLALSMLQATAFAAAAPLEDGAVYSFRMKKKTSLCVNCQFAEKESNLVSDYANEELNELFRVEKTSDGTYVFHPLHAEMTAIAADHECGWQLRTRTASSSDKACQWRLVSVGSGFYRIQNVKNSSLYWDLGQGEISSVARINGWYLDNSSSKVNQYFKPVKEREPAPKPSKKATNPIGYLDDFSVVSDTPGSTIFTIRGWAWDADTTGAVSVSVRVDGQERARFTANQSRPDVYRCFSDAGANRGFQGTLTLSNLLTIGEHKIEVVALNENAGSNTLLTNGVRSLTVKSNLGQIVSCNDRFFEENGQVKLAGWAYQERSSSAVSLDLLIDGKLSENVLANGRRDDVKRVMAGCPSSLCGYSISMPAPVGTHTYELYATGKDGQTKKIFSQQLTTKEKQIVSFLDSLDTDEATGKNLAGRGWSFVVGEPETTVQITVNVDGTDLYKCDASQLRVDVSRVMGTGEKHGFEFSVKLPTELLGGSKHVVRLIASCGGSKTVIYEGEQMFDIKLVSPVPAGCYFRAKTNDKGWVGYHDISVNVTAKTPVYAVADGTATFKQCYEEGANGQKVYTSYGNYVQLVSDFGGYKATYAHLSKFRDDVPMGTAKSKEACAEIKVKAGDLLGYIGTTGNSTGLHLHLEIWKDNKRVDPTAVIPGLTK